MHLEKLVYTDEPVPASVVATAAPAAAIAKRPEKIAANSGLYHWCQIVESEDHAVNGPNGPGRNRWNRSC